MHTEGQGWWGVGHTSDITMMTTPWTHGGYSDARNVPHPGQVPYLVMSGVYHTPVKLLSTHRALSV